jgi:uncharacterized protein YdaU (DUF1376 family)
MHYYQFNIGDYKSHTEHLSEMEDLTYRRLLDWCYLHEKPVPLDESEVARQIRMRSHTDCIAVVLREYFERTEDGWIHHRVNSELTKAGDKSQKASESAKARWTKQKDANALQTDANALQAQSEGNATHNTEHITQDTVIDSAPKGAAKAKRLSPEWQLPSKWGQWSLENMSWDEQTTRVEGEKFKDYWTAKAGKDACKLDWEATWRNWCRNAKVQPGQAGGSLLVGGI